MKPIQFTYILNITNEWLYRERATLTIITFFRMEAILITMSSVKPDNIVMKGKHCKRGMDNTYIYIMKNNNLKQTKIKC